MNDYKDIDGYIKNFPDDVQAKLETLRSLIKELAPTSKETISYGIPTFKLNGNLIHFAAYDNHIGIYPGSEAILYFKDKLTNYKLSKGTIQIPLTSELPINLINEIVLYRIKRVS